MAVIQISKIQQRRGQKLISGIPQLSSGELAWAVDTQELFIGNGSLAEGAPYVGNTKVLTEHDNILELASSYRFANDDASITFSTSRSLQSKIDEIEVSVLDFGSPVDGSTDCTEAFNNAFAELYQSVGNEKYRKVLKIPNGTYLFTQVLNIPSNIHIRGETKENVILDITAGVQFVTEDGTDIFGFDSSNRPENIHISNLTFRYLDSGVNLSGVKDSDFENVLFQGEYQLGQEPLNAVFAFQSYNITDIQENGYIRVSGTGLSSTVTENAIFGDPLLGDDSVNTILDRLVISLNNDTDFDNLFIAKREAESLVIQINPSIESALLLGPNDISDRFQVVLSINGFPNETVVSPIPTDSSSGVEGANASIYWSNNNFGTRVTNIDFIRCQFERSDLAVKSLPPPPPAVGEDPTFFETTVNFKDCKFKVCDTGIYVGGQDDRQVNRWTISNCYFEDITRHAVLTTEGSGMTIINPKTKNVGNGGIAESSLSPEFPIFEFLTKYGNIVKDLDSDRHQTYAVTPSANTKGFSETLNGGFTTVLNDHYAVIELNDTFVSLAVFSSTNRFIEIDYLLTLSNHVRRGVLTILIDDTGSDVAITDSYTYSPSLSTDPGGPTMTNFEFGAELQDNDEDSGTDTVVLTYRNPLSDGAVGTISYSYSFGV
jgi:hypothetical protein